MSVHMRGVYYILRDELGRLFIHAIPEPLTTEVSMGHVGVALILGRRSEDNVLQNLMGQPDLPNELARCLLFVRFAAFILDVH